MTGHLPDQSAPAPGIRCTVALVQLKDRIGISIHFARRLSVAEITSAVHLLAQTLGLIEGISQPVMLRAIEGDCWKQDAMVGTSLEVLRPCVRPDHLMELAQAFQDLRTRTADRALLRLH